MKKIFTTIMAVCMLHALTQAQVTLTNSITYKVGDSYTVQSCDATGITLSAAGANVTANYSTATAQGATQSSSFVTPSTTPFASDFSGATVAQIVPSSQGNTGYAYHNTTNPNKVELLGAATTFVIAYNNPQTIFQFPLNYNDTYSDDFSATYNVNGVDGKRSGTINVVADAYGNITTPKGTFAYLRLKATQNIIDSFFFNDNLMNVSVTNSVTYNYMNPSYSAPVFSYTEQTSVQGTTKSAYYNTFGSTGVNEFYLGQSGLTVYPNPAKEQLYLTVLNINLVKVYDITGKEVIRTQASELITNGSGVLLNIASLKTGLYTLVAETENGLSKAVKFAVE
ncbi:MAG: T9SS type A sorting domain-containing protein [Bacteroidota bacterium]